jgi:hypothetical protein
MYITIMYIHLNFTPDLLKNDTQRLEKVYILTMVWWFQCDFSPSLKGLMLYTDNIYYLYK